LLFASLLLAGCGGEFLEVKSDGSSVVPAKLEDYQAMLDDAAKTMNVYSPHMLGVLAGDEVYVDDAALRNPAEANQRNAYLWKKDNFYEEEQSKDWNYAFRRILYCNMVLEGISRIDPETDRPLWDNIRGSALFFRSMTYYQLAQLFCEVYEEGREQLGLPLRTDPDVTVGVQRSSLGQTYAFILDGLAEADRYLPEQPLVRTRPGKAALYGLLARIHLQMRQYPEAAQYARQCLSLQDELIDYNDLTLTGTSNTTFGMYAGLNSPELIFHGSIPPAEINVAASWRCAAGFVSLYSGDDLRKKAFFRSVNGDYRFVGSYSARVPLFSGIATDEVLLIQMEADLRSNNNNIDRARSSLNRLRQKRYARSSYTDITDTDPGRLLREILEERKKELVFRGLRWEDIRRLNFEGRYPVRIERQALGERIVIEPNDSRYVFPLPPNVVDLGGLQQNPR